jgi:hypothetical protein
MMNNRSGSLEQSLLRSTVFAAAAAVWLCVAVPGFSAEPTPLPRRASGLKAVTMEQKLYQDIQAAQHSGRDTTTASKLKAKGDAELKEGRLQAAIKHYEEAEKAVGAAK